MLSASWWQGRTFPCKLHLSLLFFFFSSAFSFLSWPVCTRAHVLAWLWRVLRKDPLWKAGLPFFFILMMNLESFPDETFITLNAFCWRGNWPETHQAATCIYSMLTPLFFLLLWNICEGSCQHFWPMTGYLKSDIWISDMGISVYRANEPSSQDVLKSESQFPDLVEIDRKLDFYWLVFVKY